MLMPPRKKVLFCSCLFATLTALGTGVVGVAANSATEDTANKLRTAPLWGLRTKARFMHDLGSLSLTNAIERHDGEAHDAAEDFRELSPKEREALITFLKTL